MFSSKKSKRIVDGNHYENHYAVAVKLARDEDPVQQAFVHRRCTITQQQWETYLGVEGTASGPGSGNEYANGQASATGTAAVQHKGGLLRRNTSTYDMEASGRNVRRRGARSPRSIFGLPIISPLAPFAKIWSSMILALDLIYTAFLIPILVSFEVPDIGWTWGCIINLIAGTIYFMELLLNFHIGFIGKWGSQKKVFIDGKAVAWYYITQGQFFVDVLTAIAWIAQIVLIILSERGVDISGPISTLYQIIRILRLVRFISLMNRLYATAIAAGGAIFPVLNLKPQYAYFVNLIYGGLAILSFLSCIMNFVSRREYCNGSWLSRFGVVVRTYGSPDSVTAGVLNQEDCAAVPDAAKWLAGAYFMLVTMLSIGYGDVTPATITEVIICMFCMIAGIIFFGILLGSIADALNDLNKESKRIAKYRSRMETVDKWMGKRGLSKSLRMRIGQHYQEEWIADTEALEEVQIMEEVPHVLRREIAYACNRKIFERLRIFHDFPLAEQQTIAAMMNPLQLPAGADLCEAGDVADCIWLLHEGSVATVDAAGYETSVTSAAALLGETALLRELDDEFHFRPSALRTRQICLLWVIPMRDLLPLLRRNPMLYHKAVQEAVPSMSFDYLTINPIGNQAGGGVASAESIRGGGGKHGSEPTNGSNGSSLVSSRKGGSSGQSFHGVVQSAQAASNGNTDSPSRPLHPLKSALSAKSSQGSEGKPSWTTLQASYGKSRSVNAKQFKALMNLS